MFSVQRCFRKWFADFFRLCVGFKGLILIVAQCSLALTSCTLVLAQKELSDAKALSGQNDKQTLKKLIPGILPDGRTQLPNQWSLKPAGKQLVLGDFPVNIALHPKEPFAAILHSGYAQHEVIVVDLAKDRILGRTILTDTFLGICFDDTGTQLYVSGGLADTVERFAFDKGYLSKPETLPLSKERSSKIAASGLICFAENTKLAVCQMLDHSLGLVTLPTADGAFKNTSIEKIELEKNSFPYAVIEDAKQKRLYVSLWGAAAIVVIDPVEKKVLQTWTTRTAGEKLSGDHPTELLLDAEGERLFVSCANSNNVVVLDTEDGHINEVLNSALYSQMPLGSTPSSIALSPNGKVLAVANADNNNVAMFDISTSGKAKALGHIPVGWYPTAVRFEANSNLLVTNGKGNQSFANPQGPNPLAGANPTRQYIGSLFRGTLSTIPTPSPTQMTTFSQTARTCSPLQSDAKPLLKTRTANNPIPAEIGQPSPLKHCIYIIKENRTYDQVLGDLPQGNGDPQLCLFPDKVTPNQHALAKEFVLLDNFYVESEVSADGHEWSMAAYATDFVERTWPLNYRGGPGDKIGYPSEGAYRIAAPASGYIWDKCAEANVTYRSYGEFIANGAKPGDPGKERVESLAGHFDPYFRSYDLDYSDLKRTDRFLEELKEFEKNNNLPQFIVLRLPNNHTHGARVGKLTPTSMVAENDLALGKLIEGVSNSRFWPETAFFVLEDDAQNGSDHVDAHRSIAFVASPYVKRHQVDSTMYSGSSMLRTMELILGLKPMTQFDAAAMPMFAAFTDKPDLTPFKHVPAQVSLTEVNTPKDFGAEVSAKLDFSREDAADDLVLNEIIWRSVRGAKSVMPPPVRASFVRIVKAQDDDDDDEKEEAEEKEKAEQAAESQKHEKAK